MPTAGRSRHGANVNRSKRRGDYRTCLSGGNCGHPPLEARNRFSFDPSWMIVFAVAGVYQHQLVLQLPKAGHRAADHGHVQLHDEFSALAFQHRADDPHLFARGEPVLSM
jgi:hypothetical protein